MRACVAAAGFSILLAGCSANPASPDSGAPPATLAGTWSIDFTVDNCGGNRQCVHSLGKPRTVTLRLLESNGRYTGIFSTGSFDAVEVEGQEAGGYLTLSGIKPAAFPGVVGSNSNELTKFSARLRNGAAAGTLEYASRGVAQGDFFGNMVTSGTITKATRLDDDAIRSMTFAGRWSGMVAIRSCSFRGWIFCTPLQRNTMAPLELDLAQSGAAVSGTLRLSGSTVMDVTGTVSGATVTLNGAMDRVVSGGRDVATLLEFSATRDQLGTLKGTFRYKSQYLMTSGGENQTTYDAVELWTVLLR